MQQLQSPFIKADSKTVAICVGTALWLIYSLTRDNSDNKGLPPLVPYRYPFIGSTYDYQSDPDGFTRRATEKYGPIFRVYMSGRIVTIVSSKDHIKRLVSSEPELDFFAAIRDSFDIQDAIGATSHTEDQAFISILTRYLNPNLKMFTPRVLQQLEKGMNVFLGDFEGSVTLDNPTIMINTMITRASASIFVGTDICENAELLNSFSTLASDVGKLLSNNLFGFFPWFSRLQSKISLLLFSPTKKHSEIIKRIVFPIVEQRKRDKARLGDKWEKPEDVLQQFIDIEDPNLQNLDFIMKSLFKIVFVSIHTTTLNTTTTLQMLAKNPEYIAPLRAEIQSVVAEADEDEGPFTGATLKKMVMLDSFVREAFRFSDGAIRLPHKNVTSSSFDIGDGVLVPAGQHVSINVSHAKLDDAHGPEPETFSPWRYVDKAKSATKVGPDYLKFGIGKHACPGRFLAVQEVKTAVSFIVSRYDFTAVLGPDGKPTDAIVFTKI